MSTSSVSFSIGAPGVAFGYSNYGYAPYYYAPAPAPYGFGGDPLVPSDTGADPYVFLPPGYELPG